LKPLSPELKGEGLQDTFGWGCKKVN
jgi:hypothetical protein